MLLIDRDQMGITPVRLEQLRRPFVPVTGLRTVEDAREFLCRFQRSGADLRRILAIEMMQEGWSIPSPAMTDVDVITAAAREIASRRLQVVALLPENPIIRFDEAPYHGSFDDAAFVNRTVAAAFLAALRTDRQAVAAIDRAFARDSMSTWAEKDRTSPPTSKAPDADWHPDEVARLLTAGSLLLLPLDSARRAFRLVWRQWSSKAGRSGAPSTGAARPQAPPPPRPRSPQPVQYLPPPPARTRSPLPKPPSSNSPQADALIAAAQRGVPFCEECARAAGH